MSKKRMFAPDVVEMDSFVEMSNEARLLYFYLGLYTDDDGFVNNPKSVARLNMLDIHALNELIENKFVIPFESGVIVITHWHINNKIRGDRYKETVFKNELNLLKLENNIYILNPTQIDSGIPNDNQVATQVKLSKDKLSKDNISENKINKNKLSEDGIPNDNQMATNGIPGDNKIESTKINYNLIVSLLNKIVIDKSSLTDGLKNEIDNAIDQDYQFIQKLKKFVDTFSGQMHYKSSTEAIEYIVSIK